MKFLLTCVLATALVLVGVAVAIGYFRQARSLQAQLATAQAQLATATKELHEAKSDLERAKSDLWRVSESQLTYAFHESFIRYFGKAGADAVEKAVKRGGTGPDVLVRDLARGVKIGN